MKNRMTPLRKLRFSAFLIAVCLCLQTARAQETPTVPVGYMTLTAAAGTGTVKKVTMLSIPFYGFAEGDGQLTGTITSLTPNTLSNASANWTPSQLSGVATPYLIKLTSGAATGRTLLISTAVANTATTVTIDAKDIAQAALTTLGIAPGDSYKILPCDTIGSLFGTPATTGIQGGVNVNLADNLMISTNGQHETFYYNNTLNRWAKSAFGNPDATHIPLRPDSGIRYSRLAASDLQLTLAGRVSTTARIAAVKNSGVTILSQNWPIDTTLITSGIHQIPKWTAAPSAANADIVQITVDGTTRNYWFDGTHWHQDTLGSPIADDQVITAGSSVFLSQKGTETGYSPLMQPIPYTIE